MRKVILFLFMLVPLLGADMETLMRQGNAHYQAGRFEEAIAAYQKVLNTGMASGALYYNLGCAWFELDEVGEAILAFQRAKRLLPRDEDVTYNLEHARLYRHDRFDLPAQMPIVRAAAKARSAYTVAELRWGVAISFGLFLAAFIAYRVTTRNRPRPAFLYVAVVSAFIFIVLGGWMVDRMGDARRIQVVVLDPVAECRSAPLATADVLFNIHEGTEGRIEQETDDWYEIQLPDGKRAWLPKEVVGTF